MGCGESNVKSENKNEPTKPSANPNAQKKEVDNKGSNSGQTNSPPKKSSDKPVVIFVVGGPGSGKGTQCANIVQEYGWAHLSTGDLLRQEKDSGSELANEINSIMKEGKLVPSIILIKLLKKAMEEIGWDKRFLIDGFPRGQENVDVWKDFMGDSVIIRCVLYFELDEDTMRARLLERGKTSGRSDDNEESIIKRFKTFQEESVPIIKQFEDSGKLITINSAGSKDEVFEQVQDLFKKPEVVFVVGGPGSGKGTQCANLVEEFGFGHLSTGDLLRKEKDSGSAMADEINSIMKEGKLVPSLILIKLLKNEMESLGWNRKLFLIDGFPRGQENVDVWQQFIGDQVTIKFVLYFELDEETMRERLLERGKTSGRSDDNEESIIKRFKTFQNESVPIIKQFEDKGMVRTINSKDSKEIVFDNVKEFFI